MQHEHYTNSGYDEEMAAIELAERRKQEEELANQPTAELSADEPSPVGVLTPPEIPAARNAQTNTRDMLHLRLNRAKTDADKTAALRDMMAFANLSAKVQPQLHYETPRQQFEPTAVHTMVSPPEISQSAPEPSTEVIKPNRRRRMRLPLHRLVSFGKGYGHAAKHLAPRH